MMLKAPDGRFIDIGSGDIICDFDEAFGAGYADACRESARIARKVVGDSQAAKTAILARLRNGWTVIVLEPDEDRREMLKEKLALAKLNRDVEGHVVEIDKIE